MGRSDWRRTIDRRSLFFDLLHVGVLSYFAVAQPLFDLFAEGAEVLAFVDPTPTDLLVFAAVIVMGPPLSLCAAELVVLALAGQRWQRRVHAAVVAVLVALFAAAPLDRATDGRGELAAVLLATAIGVAGAWLYGKASAARMFVSMLSPAPLVFTTIFLVASPVSAFVFPSDLDPLEADLHFGATPPIILVVLDELPLTSILTADGTIDRARYPNFATFASRSTWYRQATTVSADTSRAVPSIVTGRLPKKGDVAVVRDHPNNLFRLLAPRYDVRATGLGSSLCPAEVCSAPTGSVAWTQRLRVARTLLHDARSAYGTLVLPERVEEALNLPPLAELGLDMPEPTDDEDAGFVGEPGSTSEVRLARLHAMTDEIRKRSRPTFDFIHTVLPHSPWGLLPTGQGFVDHGGTFPGLSVVGEWVDQRWPVVHSYQRHLAQVAAVDLWVGELQDHLTAEGMWEDALVILTSDHGASFRPGEKFRQVTGPGDVLDDVMPVPLFVKYPGQTKGSIDDRNAESIDILPTIIDLLDIGIDWQAHGRSLLDTSPSDRKRFSTDDWEVLDLAPDWDATLAAAQRKLSFTGLPAEVDDELDAHYRVGPFGSLVGEWVSDLPVGKGPTFELDIDGEDALEVVRPSAPRLPALLVGVTEDASAVGTHVAVAINGRIAAVAEVALVRDKAWLYAMLAAPLLTDGRNALDFYTLTSDPGNGVSLTPLAYR